LILKLKYVIWLVCLLLFVAAVDTIPDPPAINPPGHSSGVSAPHVRGPGSQLEKKWSLGIHPLRTAPIHPFSVSFRLEDETIGPCCIPLVFHATDASPPVLS
jgi:hypothetical protein